MLYVRQTQCADLELVFQIYANARLRMAANGNPTQWGTDKPSKTLIEEDCMLGRSYVICDEHSIRGVFCLMTGEDPTYRIIDGEWHSQKPYVTVHRIAGEGGGIFSTCVKFAKKYSDYIRVDTHENNVAMQRAIHRENFKFCGIIHVEDGSPRFAYDKELL